MRVRARWVVMSGLAAGGIGLLAWLFAPRPIDVDAHVIATGPIADVVADQGIARVRQAYVVAASVTGQLERLPLEVGDRVVANQTVMAYIRPAAPAFLDPRSQAQAESAVRAAAAALTAARAQRDRLAADTVRTRDQLRRLSDLAAQRVVATQELDNAQAAAAEAAHGLRAAEADIATHAANLTSARLALATPQPPSQAVIKVTSPASGVVTRVLQKSARTVGVGTPLVEVGDTNGLEAAIEFLSQDAVKITPGQRADIYNWGGPANIRAEVRLVEPQGYTKISALGVEEQRTLVILQFTSAPETWSGLAPGFRVWGRIYLRELPSVTLAPLGALVRDNGHWAVFRIDDGRARLVRIEVGTLTDRSAEILSGVKSGDTVVLYPSDQVREGLRVRRRE